jgi:hypothetical protein
VSRPKRMSADSSQAIGRVALMRRTVGTSNDTVLGVVSVRDVRRRSRQFTLLDAAVLVAATALGMGGYRFFGPSSRQLHLPIRLAPCLASWTVALLLLHLRTPRCRVRRLVRKPGFSGCVASLTNVAIVAIVISIDYAALMASIRKNGGAGWINYYFRSFFLSCFFTGPLVLSSWFILLLSGHWRLREDWLEWSSRIVGFLWMIDFIVFYWMQNM